MSYLNRIANAKDRFEAADLVLAWATHCAGRLQSCSDEERLSIVDNAARHAEQLTVDYAVDEEGFVSEATHPWRAWLKEWGYTF